MLQSPDNQIPARKSDSFWAAGSSLLAKVVCVPVILTQASITIMLPDV
jgi:hypothetical protein